MSSIEHLDFVPEGVDAWALTAGQNNEVEIQPEFAGSSAPNMCAQSTDEGRHYWWKVAVAAQSVERLECEFCHETLFD